MPPESLTRGLPPPRSSFFLSSVHNWIFWTPPPSSRTNNLGTPLICGSALHVRKDNIEMWLIGAWFQASAAKQIRTALFRVLTDVLGPPVGPILTTEDGTIGCRETSVRNCHHSLRNNPEERTQFSYLNEFEVECVALYAWSNTGAWMSMHVTFPLQSGPFVNWLIIQNEYTVVIFYF